MQLQHEGATIAPTVPPAPGSWRDHQDCEWSWQIEPSRTDTAVCIAHNVEFELPNADEAYTL